MGKIRVQEYVSATGRYYLSREGFDDILSAMMELRKRALYRYHSYQYYDVDTDRLLNNASLESDKNIHITVNVSNSRYRRFTLVTRRRGEPVPFGHLIERG